MTKIKNKGAVGGNGKGGATVTIYNSRYESCDPNPILVNFRGVEGARPGLWLYMVQSDLIDPDDWLSSGHSMKHLEHAERVFKRMVSVYEGGKLHARAPIYKKE